MTIEIIYLCDWSLLWSFTKVATPSALWLRWGNSLKLNLTALGHHKGACYCFFRHVCSWYTSTPANDASTPTTLENSYCILDAEATPQCLTETNTPNAIVKTIGNVKRDKTDETAKVSPRNTSDPNATSPTKMSGTKNLLLGTTNLGFTFLPTWKTQYEDEKEFVNKKELQQQKGISRSREGITLTFDSNSTQQMTVFRLRPNPRRCHPRDNRQKPVAWGPFFWRSEIFPWTHYKKIVRPSENGAKHSFQRSKRWKYKRTTIPTKPRMTSCYFKENEEFLSISSDITNFMQSDTVIHLPKILNLQVQWWKLHVWN